MSNFQLRACRSAGPAPSSCGLRRDGVKSVEHGQSLRSSPPRLKGPAPNSRQFSATLEFQRVGSSDRYCSSFQLAAFDGDWDLKAQQDGDAKAAPFSDVLSDEYARSWVDAGEVAPTRQQKQNRRRRRRYRQAKRQQKMMGRTSQARGFTRYMQSLKSQRRPEKIVEEVKAARSAAGGDGDCNSEKVLNIISYNAALSALVDLQEFDMAREVFDLIEADFGLDLVAMCSMIKGYGKSGNLDPAFKLLDYYEDSIKNTAPRRLYVVLLNACADAGDVRRARAMMHRIEMQEELLVKLMKSDRKQYANFNTFGAGPPDSRPPPTGSNSQRGVQEAPAVNAASEGNEESGVCTDSADNGSENGNGKLSDSQVAETSTNHRFRIGHLDMSSKRTQFNLLAKAYSNSNMPLKWENLLEEMRNAGVSPDRVTFNQLLAGVAKVGGQEAADAAAEILHRMKGLAVACEDPTMFPDSISYTCALRAATDGTDALIQVQRLLSEMEDGLEMELTEKKVVHHRFYPDSVCITTAIEVLCKIGELEKAMDYMESWQRRGRAASPRGLLSLLWAYAERGELDICRFLHSRITREEIAGKINGRLLYEANQSVAHARKKAYQRNMAFSISMVASAQARDEEDNQQVNDGSMGRHSNRNAQRGRQQLR